MDTNAACLFSYFEYVGTNSLLYPVWLAISPVGLSEIQLRVIS